MLVSHMLASQVTMHLVLTTTYLSANLPQDSSLTYMYVYKFSSKLPHVLMHFTMYLRNAMISNRQDYVIYYMQPS